MITVAQSEPIHINPWLGNKGTTTIKLLLVTDPENRYIVPDMQQSNASRGVVKPKLLHHSIGPRDSATILILNNLYKENP